jgi:uracil-DNA glycosylase
MIRKDPSKDTGTSTCRLFLLDLDGRVIGVLDDRLSSQHRTMITSFFKPKARRQPNKASSPGSETFGRTSISTDDSSSVGTATKRRKRDADAADDDDDFDARANDGGGDIASTKRAKVGGDGISHSDARITPPAVTELIEHLEPGIFDDDDGPRCDANADGQEGVQASWKSALARHFATSQFVRLAEFVASERRSHTVYPLAHNTWTALNLCPPSKVKVVIVGQDPYHGPRQAHGLAFSVEHGQAIPPSLRNVYKELCNDPAVPDFDCVPKHGNLVRWARQGVLMLNAVMTVRSGSPNSHAKRGWEATTDEILRAVAASTTGTNSPLVFLLWGKPAFAKAEGVLAKGAFNIKKTHTVICTSHPSPLGATKTSSPFLGSRCFSRCNDALVKNGQVPIDWRVDGPL